MAPELPSPRGSPNQKTPLTPREQRLRRRERVGTVLILIGAGLLLAAAGQYGYMYSEQAALQRQWRAAVQRHQMERQADALHAQVMQASARSLRGPIRILIPSIGVDNILVRGTSYGSLLAGPGWMNGTPPPGVDGNMVVAGHRDTFFLRVHSLVPGDMIWLERAARKFRYVVVSKKIISPADTAVLKSTSGSGPVLTLVTCYPTYWVGPAPDRLVVRAKLAAALPSGATLAASAR